MIKLDDYKNFWATLVSKIGGLKDAIAVSVDDDMARYVQSLKTEGDATLFYLPPSMAMEGGTVDDRREVHHCVALVVVRYDAQRSNSWDALAIAQPVVEKIKDAIIREETRCDGAFSAVIPSIGIMPETELFRGFAGWSIGFKAY